MIQSALNSGEKSALPFHLSWFIQSGAVPQSSYYVCDDIQMSQQLKPSADVIFIVEKINIIRLFLLSNISSQIWG